MKKDCHRLWTEKLFDALQLLSSRLDDPPSLSELAAVAEFSPFHFHRIWRVLLNESVHQTVCAIACRGSTTETASARLHGH